MRYEATWLLVFLGLILETSMTFVLPWTAVLPLLSVLLILGAVAAKTPRTRRLLDVAAEAVGGLSAAVYAVLMVLYALAAEGSPESWYLGPAVLGIAAFARVGLAVLALLGAGFVYGTAWGLIEARTLPEVVPDPKRPLSISGYRLLLNNMRVLFLVNAVLAVTLAIAAEVVIVSAYLRGTWDGGLFLFLSSVPSAGSIGGPLYWGGIATGFLLAILGLAGTAQALRGAREVPGDQTPFLAVALLLWGMSLLIHAFTAFVPTVPGGIVAILALSAAARTLSNFYPWQKRLKFWLIALVISGMQFPANALARTGPEVCRSLLGGGAGRDSCSVFLGEAGSLVAVMGSVIFGYLFAAYYGQVLTLLHATRERNVPAPIPRKVPSPPVVAVKVLTPRAPPVEVWPKVTAEPGLPEPPAEEDWIPPPPPD